MPYLPDAVATSPGATDHDPTWQLHSSTDSYLNWDVQNKVPLSQDQIARTEATPPLMSRLRSTSSSTSPFTASAQMSSEPPSTDSPALPLHPQTSSPEQPVSPSYFTRHYFHAPERTPSATSPSITLTGAPAEPQTMASIQHTAQSADTEAARERASSVSASGPGAAATPLSPTTSTKSTTASTGFFASLRPNSPGVVSTSTTKAQDGEVFVKPRRPNSVFEHVGNVWERFGRKVHHTRAGTSDQQSGSSRARALSQATPPIGLTPEVPDPTDAARNSPSSSVMSHTSPSQSTATDSEYRTPATPIGETPASLSASQPLPSAPAYAAISSVSSAAAVPQQDEPEELAYLAPESPETEVRDQATAGYPSGQPGQRPGMLNRRKSSLFERVLIQVTDDNERFSVVDISGVDSSDAIKERMFAKLHLFDADHSSFQLFRTEIGQAEASGPVVDDDALLVLCLQMGDDRGTLKFLVHQTAPHPNSTVRALPPPTSSTNQPRVLNEARTSIAGSAAGHHLRTSSQSSKSSVSDALVYPDVLSADNSHDGSNRNSTSSLMRSRAQARRVLPSAPPADELRSPIQASSGFAAHGTFQDRRSVASSSEGSSHEWARHGGSVSEGTPAPMIKQRSSSASTNATEAPGSTNSGRRPSYMDEDGLLHFSSHRHERSDDGTRDTPRQPSTASTAQAQSLTFHNARSMDDLQSSSQPSALASEADLRKQAGQDRDGRYPAAAIMRPSTVAPSSLGAREGAAVHRQYSSDAQGTGRDFANGVDPRMLQRNRSAQAVMSGGQQLSSQIPTRMQSTQIRSPPLQHSYPAQSHVDPRFNGQPSLNMQARPAHPSGRPQYTAPPNYGASTQFAAQTFGQGSRPVGPGFVNEFGGRAPASGSNFNTYHGHDPRLSANSVQGSLTPRPYSYHEQPPMHHQVAYRPFGQQTVAAPSPYRTREDPFTTRFFPASSSRQVSEFQIQAGRLEPGMTVQQTLRTQEAIRNTGTTTPGQPYHSQAHPPGPSYGPRDPRQPIQPSQYTAMQGYPNASGALQMQQRPSPQPSPRPQSYPSTPATSQPLAHQPQNQSLIRNTQERSHTIPQSSGTTASRGSTQQQSSSSFSQANVAESQRRDPPVRTNASERSSGSSFSSQTSSQSRPASNEDRIGNNSTEDSFSAPTTARSSQSGVASTKPSNAENRSSYADQDRELGDDELAHVRPLPKLPSFSAATTPNDSGKPIPSMSNKGSERKSEDEDTLRAGEWAQLRQALDSTPEAKADGTATSGSSGGDGGTLRADAGTPGASRPRPKDGVAAKVVPPRASSPNVAPEDNGTVMSFGNFDDDDYESGTWAQPLDSDTNAPRLPLRLDSDDEKDDHPTLQPGEGTAMPSIPLSSSPKRPELHLTIDPAAGPTVLTATQQRLGILNRNSAHLSSAISGIGRSNSFARRDDDWAFRPPPEQLYENLDDFFPKHDLDKPLLDTATVPESPVITSPKAESVVGAAASHSGAHLGAHQTFSQRSRHKKSIRLVAQDRKRFLDRAEKRPSAQETNNNLLRRSSTKLWGTKVVEMTPGQEAATPASTSSGESPGSETPSAKPVFKWVKGDLIGKGTYGRVYLALNATTGEMIAVKQVELPRTASDREDSRQKGVVAALKSEIETLKDLDHPHIVSYLGFEETTQFLSIFLEYVPGGSVGSCLRKHGKFEESTIKSFLHQILEGLAYLHSKGILHRDLKADNILVDFEGICKISDFGTVRRSDDIYGNVENMSLQGSIFWMAPEVVSLSKKGYSAKIDIWSLGCVVLEMFAGRRPWSDDEAVQAMFKIGAERKAPPIPADVKLSKQATHFLKNCFEVDPAKRPTAQRLLDHVFSVPDESWHFQQSALWRSLQR